jgi:glycosyltransferase involved in cell wall biosynthesis
MIPHRILCPDIAQELTMEKQRKVLIGTPTYDGKLTAQYVHSLVNTIRQCPPGISVDFLFIAYDALVQRARNDLIVAAVKGDVDDLVFIDADNAWEPQWFYEVLGHDVDVVGLPYPKKTDQETYPIKCVSRIPGVGPNGLVLVDGMGTGFLRISRRALQYVWQNSPGYVENGIEKRMAFNVNVVNREIISEDISFCEMLKPFGVYVDPRFTMPHIGHKVYVGNFGAWLSNLLKFEAERARAGAEKAKLEAEKSQELAGSLADVQPASRILVSTAGGQDPRICALYVLFDDYEYLDMSLESVYDSVDAVFLLKNSKPWNGENRDTSEVTRYYRRLCQQYPKCRLVEGTWDRDEEHRNAGIALAKREGFTYQMVIDTDEAYDSARLGDFLREVRRGRVLEAIHCSWYTFWRRSPLFRIDPIENYNPVMMINVNSFEFFDKREGYTAGEKYGSSASRVLVPKDRLMCYHFSYARDDKYLRNKLKGWSHSHEVVPNWYEEKWLQWTEDMTDLHPVNPPQYKRAVRQNLESLPPNIRKYFGT